MCICVGFSGGSPDFRIRAYCMKLIALQGEPMSSWHCVSALPHPNLHKPLFAYCKVYSISGFKIWVTKSSITLNEVHRLQSAHFLEVILLALPASSPISWTLISILRVCTTTVLAFYRWLLWDDRSFSVFLLGGFSFYDDMFCFLSDSYMEKWR